MRRFWAWRLLQGSEFCKTFLNCFWFSVHRISTCAGLTDCLQVAVPQLSNLLTEFPISPGAAGTKWVPPCSAAGFSFPAMFSQAPDGGGTSSQSCWKSPWPPHQVSLRAANCSVTPNQIKPNPAAPPQLCWEKQRNKHSPCKVTQLQTSPGTPGLSSLAKPSCSPPTDGRSTSSPGALGMSQMCSSTGSQLLTRHTACSGSQFPPIWGGFDLLACSVIAIPWVYGSQRTCESSWEQQGEKPL